MSLRRLLAAAALLGFASLVSAATLSGSARPNSGSVGQRVLGGCGTTVLTQSTSQTITALNSVSCNAGGVHTDNSYFRAFSLGAFPNGFDVCALQFGVEQATGAGGSQPVTVNIYANTGGAFPLGTRALVGTAAATVSDQALTITEVAVTGTVPAGAELIAEVFTPDGTAASNTFFIGSNDGGESGPSYIAAAACGIANPTATTAIGFANMQIVMNVLGTPVQEDVPSVPVPTFSAFGLALMGLLVVSMAFWSRRRA